MQPGQDHEILHAGVVLLAADEEGDARHGDEHDGRRAGGKAVQTVGQVDGVAEAGEHEEDDGVVADRADVELASAGSGTSMLRVEAGEAQRDEADEQRQSKLQQQLVARRQPERALAHDLDVVVDEADEGAAEGRDHDRESGHREVAEDEERHDHGQPDEAAAHGRRAGLGLVVLGALLADVLAELVAAQPLDEPGADGEHEHHRGDAAGKAR